MPPAASAAAAPHPAEPWPIHQTMRPLSLRDAPAVSKMASAAGRGAPEPLADQTPWLPTSVDQRRPPRCPLHDILDELVLKVARFGAGAAQGRARSPSAPTGFPQSEATPTHSLLTWASSLVPCTLASLPSSGRSMANCGSEPRTLYAPRPLNFESSQQYLGRGGLSTSLRQATSAHVRGARTRRVLPRGGRGLDCF